MPRPLARTALVRAAATAIATAVTATAVIVLSALALGACGSGTPAPAAGSPGPRTFTDAADKVSFAYTSPVLSPYSAGDLRKSTAWTTVQGIASSGAKVVALASDQHAPVHVWLAIAAKPSLQVQGKTARQVAGTLLPGQSRSIARGFATGMGVPASSVTATTGLFHGAPSILLSFHQAPQSFTARAFGVRLIYTRTRAFMLMWLTDKAASTAEQRAIDAAAASVTASW